MEAPQLFPTLYCLPAYWAPRRGGKQVLVSKIFVFTVLLLGRGSLRKAPGGATHHSWPLYSQTLLSQGISTPDCIISVHDALCLHPTFCQVLTA